MKPGFFLVLFAVLFTSISKAQDPSVTQVAIQPITDALDKLAQVNAVYVQKDGKTFAVLDVAQIEASLPGTIKTDSSGRKTIDFEQLGAMTLAAMKEQQMIMDEQEARIRQLEAFETDRKVMESELIRLTSQYHDLIKRLQHLETKESLGE